MNEILVIGKPDLVIRRGAGALMLKEFFNVIRAKIVASNKLLVSEHLAVKHYGHLKGRYFYDWLIEYIQCYDSLVFAVETLLPVQKIREMLGDTIIENADPQSIRARLGLYNGMNGLHVSESSEAGTKEIRIWTDEKALEHGKLKFDLNTYLENYISAPNYTKEVHALLSTHRRSESVNDKQVHVEFLELLKKEAINVEPKIVNRFNELFWQGMNLHK